jgi:hypothetical protein
MRGEQQPPPRAHRWAGDRCMECGIRRREEWVLDDTGSAVMALVWSTASGQVVRVRQFPVLLGVAPPAPPTQTVSAAFPGVPIGREPECRWWASRTDLGISSPRKA